MQKQKSKSKRKIQLLDSGLLGDRPELYKNLKLNFYKVYNLISKKKLTSKNYIVIMNDSTFDVLFIIMFGFLMLFSDGLWIILLPIILMISESMRKALVT